MPARSPEERACSVLPGARLGPLCIERLLGVGGMGEVYLARDARLERPVAVKMLTDSDARDRMLREARAVSALRHPGIVTVYDIGEHEGRTFIAMEYVEGQTLEAMVARRGPLAPAEAVELFAQVGDALATVHDAGILHRDIKSANLMVDGHGRIRVLDFGLCKHNRVLDTLAAGGPADRVSAGRNDDKEHIALRVAPTIHDKHSARRADRQPRSGASTAVAEIERSSGSRERGPDRTPTTARSPGAIATGLQRSGGTRDEPQTEAGARLGTPGWAPPELMNGQPAEVRSDVFSLGAVLYHLLTGQIPFPGQTWRAAHAQVARGPERPSQFARSIPPALDAVILSALAADPDRRPASVRDLVARARDALGGRRQRRGRLVALVAAIAACGGVLAVLAWTSAAPDPRLRTPAVPAATSFLQPERLTVSGGCADRPASLTATRSVK